MMKLPLNVDHIYYHRRHAQNYQFKSMMNVPLEIDPVYCHGKDTEEPNLQKY